MFQHSGLYPRLELRTVSTHDTGRLYPWRFTALPESGSIVVEGLSAEYDPRNMHQYRLEGGRLQKLRGVKWPCEHVPDDILGVMVEGQELLAVTCSNCEDIKLMNLETGETHVAYSSEKKLYRLCHGEAGRMWFFCWIDHTVRELNCSSKTFTETGRTVNTTDFCYYMCYLPAPHRALVITHRGWMEAVSCETGQLLWRLNEVDGKDINFGRMIFDPQFALLIMVDRVRLLLQNPSSGELLRSFFPPTHSAQIRNDVLWLRGQLLLLLGNSRIAVIELVDPAEGWFSGRNFNAVKRNVNELCEVRGTNRNIIPQSVADHFSFFS